MPGVDAASHAASRRRQRACRARRPHSWPARAAAAHEVRFGDRCSRAAPPAARPSTPRSSSWVLWTMRVAEPESATHTRIGQLVRRAAGSRMLRAHTWHAWWRHAWLLPLLLLRCGVSCRWWWWCCYNLRRMCGRWLLANRVALHSSMPEVALHQAMNESRDSGEEAGKKVLCKRPPPSLTSYFFLPRHLLPLPSHCFSFFLFTSADFNGTPSPPLHVHMHIAATSTPSPCPIAFLSFSLHRPISMGRPSHRHHCMCICISPHDHTGKLLPYAYHHMVTT